MPLKLVFIVVAPVALTCGILQLSSIPWRTNVGIGSVLLAFLFIVGLCERVRSGARTRGGQFMAALAREPAIGLGRAAIASLPVYKYEKLRCGGGEGHQCAVCLAEVRPKEVVKQLPACTHLFHDRCIDEWLWSHRTCPVCRSPVDASTVPAMEIAARAMQSV
ncbi:hypothetical protein CFC21_100850 [Triticum aestivum]|uniref:RING-type domain-containing protein n=2 Tax=Triticum aestivum TaxID=4565 RepID=A0A3B6RQF8_WHEAT|nr:hypothetical protein CFC21_100850 [Triticum aestivum]